MINLLPLLLPMINLLLQMINLPAATAVTDDKPADNSDVENLPSGDVQDEKNAYDFLASVT